MRLEIRRGRKLNFTNRNFYFPPLEGLSGDKSIIYKEGYFLSPNLGELSFPIERAKVPPNLKMGFRLYNTDSLMKHFK